MKYLANYQPYSWNQT